MKQHTENLTKVITFDGKQMTLAEFDALPHDWEYDLSLLPTGHASDGHFKVYVLLNKLNGKKYFGLTGQDEDDRWKNGKGYAGQRVGRAIQQYGWNNFAKKVLFDGLSLKNAQQCERQLIAMYHADWAEGYNETAGGEYGGEYEATDEEVMYEELRHAAEGWFERRAARFLQRKNI